MNLVYIDESGNTGLNLKDSQQPVFLLAAMILPESKWFSLERLFLSVSKEYFGDPLPDPFEIHAKDLDSAKSYALQLVDLAAYYIRKYEENELGLRVSHIDVQTFGKIRELVSTGVGSNIVDVLEWVKKYYIQE